MGNETKGRRFNQKLKPYIILQYLLKNTDENNTRSARRIQGYFQETLGIDINHQTISRDIVEINKVLYMLENNCDIYDAENDVYTCTVEIANSFEYVDLFATLSPTESIMEGFSGYQGSLETEFTERFYL